MRRIKLIIVSAVALLLLFIILQNTESVETRVLWMTFALPRALLLGSTFVVGVLTGILWTAGSMASK